MRKIFPILTVLLGLLCGPACAVLIMPWFPLAEPIEAGLYILVGISMSLLLGIALIKVGIRQLNGESLPRAWVNRHFNPGIDGIGGLEIINLPVAEIHEHLLPNPDDRAA
jgi:hypothetical protein